MAIFAEPMGPGDVEPFAIEYTFKDGVDSVASVDWTVPAGFTKVTQSLDGNTAIVKLRAAADPGRYPVVADMTSAQGREISRTILIPVSPT